MKSKLVSTIVALVVLAFTAPRLVYGNEGAIKGGAGGFMFGLNRFDLADLNTKLKDNAFESLDDNSAFYGGGGYGIREKVLLGGEGGSFKQNVRSDSLKVSVSGDYGFFDVGYVILSKGNWRLFPMFGLGGGDIDLKITERSSGKLIKDGNDDGMLFQVAVGTDYLLKLGGNEKGGGGLLFGIRVGYTFALEKWSIEDMDILGDLDVGLTGPYVHLIVGGGRFAK